MKIVVDKYNADVEIGKSNPTPQKILRSVAIQVSQVLSSYNFGQLLKPYK